MASHFFWCLKTTIQMLQMIPSQRKTKKLSKKTMFFNSIVFLQQGRSWTHQ